MKHCGRLPLDVYKLCGYEGDGQQQSAALAALLLLSIPLAPNQVHLLPTQADIMFARLAAISTLAFVALAAAGGKCNTGDMQCCDSLADVRTLPPSSLTLSTGQALKPYYCM